MSQHSSVTPYKYNDKALSTYGGSNYSSGEPPAKVNIKSVPTGMTFQFSGPSDSVHATKAMAIAEGIYEDHIRKTNR